ncbi:MAG: RluA family pseudouridine synthase [Chloroflexi bacterium]|nr:MAG: RluA family pseudouridine synthase [Chloroflexota bacterium]
MPQGQTIRLTVNQTAPRLDKYLAAALSDLSRARIQQLIREGKVLLTPASGSPMRQVVRPSEAVEPGDVVTIHLPPPPPQQPEPEAVPLDVVYEDEWLVVINKPAGMVVHPAHGHHHGTLVNALLARYPDLAGLTGATGPDRPGIVHRLDRDTSGLLVVARRADVLHRLQAQFKARTVDKTYLALVFGRPATDQGIIDVPLGRDPRNRQKFAPRADGKPARTHFRVREYFKQYSLLEIKLETGRTHQIRVHLAWLGCPVVGDAVYGRRKNSLGLRRQFLHAWRLAFDHPADGRRLALTAPLAPDLAAVLEML